jgi:gamma-glutamyltranspeptidase / glutathione hydrolase
MTAAVATSDERATSAAAEVVRAGGTAVDAAVAAALVLFVVEPQSCGPGGDGFLLHGAPDGSVIALDGSGELPLGLTDAALERDGHAVLPARGAATATVPSALALFEAALARWGSQSLGNVAGPAMALARDGFVVAPTLAAAAGRATASLASDPVLGPLYAPDGRAVATGSLVRNPALADCLATVAADGAAGLLGGPVGAAVVAAVQDGGGYLSLEDLARHRTVEVAPSSASFRDTTVWELPAPTQGPAVLDALATLDAGAPVDDWRPVIDTVAATMAAAGFDLRTIGTRPTPARGDTTYIAVVDSEGRGASLITSVFGDFGSHFGVPALGGPIGNRATMLRALSLPMAPGTKPPHTTIPSLVTDGDGLRYVLGAAGGFTQPQVHVQLLVHLVERGLAPQAAIDQPRFRLLFGGDVALEPGHPLAAVWPDAAARQPGPEGFGAAQVVAVGPDGTLTAGADARRHGAAVVLP